MKALRGNSQNLYLFDIPSFSPPNRYNQWIVAEWNNNRHLLGMLEHKCKWVFCSTLTFVPQYLLKRYINHIMGNAFYYSDFIFSLNGMFQFFIKEEYCLQKLVDCFGFFPPKINIKVSSEDNAYFQFLWCYEKWSKTFKHQTGL